MSNTLVLKQIEPTVFLERQDGRLRQLVRVSITNQGRPTSGTVTACAPGMTCEAALSEVPQGESIHTLFIDELTSPADVEFVLKQGGVVLDRQVVAWLAPRHWTVHIVQRSHHDVGYTDLASNVLRQHDQFLDEAIAMADATAHYPHDAQFRICIEQAWSLWHFLHNAPTERAHRMLDLLRTGRFEVTALFGNMTTELCGSEVLARTLYHTARLKREYGVPIISAEHNDIPGMSWGLCQVLTEAGIKLFCPGLPYYWRWGEVELQSFWDEDVLFPQGVPGAFWWEAPSGKRLLLWHAGVGVAAGYRGGLPELPERLRDLEQQGHPYSVTHWPVIGGGRDNSPYLDTYAHTIKEWNERWEYPRLICSTNAMFYADFAPQVPADLPVFRGELPGQDYPVGATSTAAATAVNRNNHADLPNAEKLATAASCLVDYPYQADALFEAYEEVLWHDEHTWGFHFPGCAPAGRTSELEKAVHAYRAATLGHDVLSKAMARIADNIELGSEGFHLVVFNLDQETRTSVVRTPLRGIDNCGSTMMHVSAEDDPKGAGYLTGVLLLSRSHALPPSGLLDGKFDLLDLATGDTVPFQIIEISSAGDPTPNAAERLGGSSGSAVLGSGPQGLNRDLCFPAANVPACGYKVYRLVPQETPPQFRTRLNHAAASIENDFYRVEVDGETGCVASIYDRSAERELLDSDCPHGFGALVVRNPLRSGDCLMQNVQVRQGGSGPVCSWLEVTGSAYGHPAIKQTVTLYDGLREVHLAARILKDATPLLDVALAFPFLAAKPEFRYEANLAAMAPVNDYLPGSYWNRLTVQNWARVNDGDFSIVWSSRDAPVVSLGELWPDRMSPAHSCYTGHRIEGPPVPPDRLTNGWIYSNIANSNFRTNFSCTQAGDMLFRYAIASREGAMSDCEAALWGAQTASPLTAIFTEGPRDGALPVSAGFVEVEGDCILLACKRAEDGRGLILRLWNPEADIADAKVRLPWMRVSEVNLTNLVEEDRGVALKHDEGCFSVEVGGRGVATMRVIPQARA